MVLRLNQGQLAALRRFVGFDIVEVEQYIGTKGDAHFSIQGHNGYSTVGENKDVERYEAVLAIVLDKTIT